ncbi:hypothetical protein NP233_g3335 [Leucocoprinus birnbaumii]|uniref:SMODS and SLOG-associating 2TM effector domain-containing protein n=1 Tax=Leucocoprinus birnbaumii TaxID=56174 RepID=A0AAD5YSX5_9AGAR|nr:hypothetical protein NP233_g3335 [Leucocoprinus birnbaumii]
MSSGAGEQRSTNLLSLLSGQPAEDSRATTPPAQVGGDTIQSGVDGAPAFSVPNVESTHPLVPPPAVTAPSQAHISPLSYSSELPPATRDDLHERPHVAATSIASETEHASTSSQVLPPSTVTGLNNPVTHPTDDSPPRGQENESQETIITPTRRERATPPQDISAPALQPTPSPERLPPASLSGFETAASSQVPTHIRILSDSSLTRSPVPHTYPQLHPASQESHAAFDSEVDITGEARRSFYRKNQPLPPLPGRTTSFHEPRPMSPSMSIQVDEFASLSLEPQYQHHPLQYHPTRRPTSTGSNGSGMAGVGSGSRSNPALGRTIVPFSNGQQPAPLASTSQGHVVMNPREDARNSSVIPVLGTGTTLDRSMTLERSRTLTGKSGVDWLAPSIEEKIPERNLGDRLDFTLEVAKQERDSAAAKAKLMGWAINVAIGLQVVIGALTTGLAAATSGKNTSIMVAVMGGLSTIVASFLARARGSHEPELSTARVKDLEQFIRESEVFKLDYGLVKGSMSPEMNARLENFRVRFEELLGNSNGERRLART